MIMRLNLKHILLIVTCCLFFISVVDATSPDTAIVFIADQDHNTIFKALPLTFGEDEVQYPLLIYDEEVKGLILDFLITLDPSPEKIYIVGDHPLEFRREVEEVLDQIRPSLQADGGDVELVDVVDGVVRVRLKGACAGCPMSQMTLAFGIEKALKERIPEHDELQVGFVIAVQHD